MPRHTAKVTAIARKKAPCISRGRALKPSRERWLADTIRLDQPAKPHLGARLSSAERILEPTNEPMNAMAPVTGTAMAAIPKSIASVPRVSALQSTSPITATRKQQTAMIPTVRGPTNRPSKALPTDNHSQALYAGSIDVLMHRDPQSVGLNVCVFPPAEYGDHEITVGRLPEGRRP